MTAGPRHLKGYFALLIATVFWGCSVVAARVLMKEVPPVALSHFTAIVCASVILGVLALLKPALLRVERQDLLRFAALGTFGFAAGSTLINLAINRTSAATAVTLQYLAPVLTLCWDRWRGTERLNGWKVTAIVLSILGCGLTVGLFQGGFVYDPIGVAAALGAAVSFAFVAVYSKPIASRYDPAAVAGLTFAVTSGVLFLVHPAGELAVAWSSPRLLLLLLGFAVFLGVLPPLFFFYGLRTVTATAATIITSGEIVVAAGLAWGLLGESMGPLQMLGGAMVISAVVLIERSREDVDGVAPEAPVPAREP
jgi:drug/metabolite transporter (DMT)-like permease